MKTEDGQAVGRIIANYGAELVLANENGQYLNAVAQKKLGLIVCGDLVHYELPATIDRTTKDDINSKNELVRVVSVRPRLSSLARTDRRGQAKPIAANVTQLVVVTAPRPPFDPLLIDRYTVAARNIDVGMLLVINKTDLLDDQTTQDADTLEKTYRDIGYEVIRCSSETTRDVDSLAHALNNHVSILVGQSGVGKSSLLNQLLPELQAKTGTLSEISGLGRHTTTVTTWFDLPDGGAIIDSAGVRQFALDHLSDIDIQAGFIEISTLAINCKFNDCKHIHEPECAVLEALQNGQLANPRYEHFQQLKLKDKER